MHIKENTQLSKIISSFSDSRWYVAVALALYIFLVGPTLFSTKHQLYNLEPYPDGLLYALAGKSLLTEGSVGLAYRGNFLPIWVAPLYTLYLLPFTLLFQQPIAVLYGNFFLGILNIFVWWKILSRLSISDFCKNFMLLFYALFFQLYWLAQLPMAENLQLTLFLISIYGIIDSSAHLTKHTIVSSLLLIATKLATVPTGLLLLILASYQAYNKYLKRTSVYIGIALISLLICYIFIDQIMFLLDDLSSKGGFFDYSYFLYNMHFYLNALLGFPSKLLWKDFSFFNPLVSIIATGYLFYKSKNNAVINQLLVLLFLSQFPLLVFLNTVDVRYIILSLPVLLILFGLGLQEISNSNKFIGVCVMFVVIVSQLYLQGSLIKELLANNLLHRSTAWQYEAIMHFNTFSQTQTAEQSVEIITALPPFLVGAYQAGNYRVLPLSTRQEFIAKKQYVWGSDVPYTDLLSGYAAQVKAGKSLYITNAYITHQQQVIRDFEQYKEQFNLELVSSGCMDACNIYKISAK